MTPQNKLTILSEPVSDDAILSGGRWRAELPLSNMQVPANYYRCARSLSLHPSDTQFNIDLCGYLNVKAVVVLGNFTTVASMRLTQFTDATFSVAVRSFDTEPLEQRVLWGSLPFGAPWWYSGIKPWKNPLRRAHFQITFPENIGSRFWRVEIKDEGNPAGYVDVCRLYMAGDGVWVPQFNYSPDNNQFGIRDNSLKSSTLSGGAHFKRRVNPRYFGFSVNYLRESEVFGQSWRLMDWAGFDREVFVIPDPSDTAHLQERSFFARITQSSPIVQAGCQRGHVAFEVTEII